MSTDNGLCRTEFQFGTTKVQILQGDILNPGVDVEAVVSTDDNYLTMGSGIARLLAEQAGPDYVRAAQAQCPVKPGGIIITDAYGLRQELFPKVKDIMHGAVINYDAEDGTLQREQLVYRTTTTCLEVAQERNLRSILFPAFATGAGGISMTTCARQMCHAIKAYLAHERPLLAQIYIILYLPVKTNNSKKFEELQAKNDDFIREANLVLGVPYDPVEYRRQSRNFFGREEQLKQIEAIITGQGAAAGKRHALILGGPAMGKWALLDQLYRRAQAADSILRQGWHLVEVTLGAVHQYTPLSVVYRKLLYALGATEQDPAIKKKIDCAFADVEMDCEKFLAFRKEQLACYPTVVFLIDDMPKLVQMEAAKGLSKANNAKYVGEFWRDLDRLETAQVQFVFTANDDEQFAELWKRLEQYTHSFKHGIEKIELTCISTQERDAWLNQLYECYLNRQATPYELDFCAQEAGWHPYLISLVSHALIRAIKYDALTHPERPPMVYNQQNLEPFFQRARLEIQQPRLDFFHQLMQSLQSDKRYLAHLEHLARAVALESKRRSLLASLERASPQAEALWLELQEQEDPRQYLQPETLLRLGKLGYLVDADDPATAQFIANSFATYVADFYAAGRLSREKDQPQDVVISLLRSYPTPPARDLVNNAVDQPESTHSVNPHPQQEMIKTILQGRGAQIVMAQKPLRYAIKDEFMRAFGRCLQHELRPDRCPACAVFRNLNEVGNYILTQFTTVEIKRYLQNLSPDSTVMLLIDDALKEIPWELMLETINTTGAPFQVGRSIVSENPAHNLRPPVRGYGKVNALLIGDPTDDLKEAQQEVENLKQRLEQSDLFTVEMQLGSQQCQRIKLLNMLSSCQYGLIHYSGHTHYDGEYSAWQLKDGPVTTDMLTNALQMGPPAFVFSSSCESATGGQMQSLRHEDQTFDLPSAFLQAGVEAYIGALWAVDSTVARQFVQDFYTAFLLGHPLGHCLQTAIERRKGKDRINGLAFVLYGDPHIEPGDLFPALRNLRSQYALADEAAEVAAAAVATF